MASRLGFIFDEVCVPKLIHGALYKTSFQEQGDQEPTKIRRRRGGGFGHALPSVRILMYLSTMGFDVVGVLQTPSSKIAIACAGVSLLLLYRQRKSQPQSDVPTISLWGVLAASASYEKFIEFMTASIPNGLGKIKVC